MGENVEQRFGGLESLRIDTHLVLARQQILELVLTLSISGGLIGTSDTTRTCPRQRDLHARQRTITSIGGAPAVLVDIHEQLITDDAGTNSTEVNRVIRLSLSQGDRGRSSVGVESAVGSGIRGCCLKASRCLEGHLVAAGQQVLEGVLAIRVARLRCNDVARGIGHGGAVLVGQGNRHARQSRLVGILETVTVDVHPGVITNTCGLNKPEVHVNDRPGRLSDRHVRTRLVPAHVGLRGLSTRQRTRRRVNDADHVLPQRQTTERVLTLRIRHGRNRVAVLV